MPDRERKRLDGRLKALLNVGSPTDTERTLYYLFQAAVTIIIATAVACASALRF